MRKRNVFNVVMDCIDENIRDEVEQIKQHIYRVSGYTSKEFGEYFSMLTENESLFNYISSRKVYFLCQELRGDSSKTITDIAYDFSYSSPPVLNHYMKSFYNCTPTDVRKGKIEIPNKKYQFSDFDEKILEKDNHYNSVTRKLKNAGWVSEMDFDYIEAFNVVEKEYGFDIDTCYAISEVAERLGLPLKEALEGCYELMIDIRSDPDYLPPKTRAAIEYGIESDAELKEICKYYDCKHYDLDSFMVRAYRERNK